MATAVYFPFLQSLCDPQRWYLTLSPKPSPGAVAIAEPNLNTEPEKQPRQGPEMEWEPLSDAQEVSQDALDLTADQLNAADRQRALIAMCVLIGISQLGFGGIVPVLPLYAGSFGVSAFAIGLTIAVFGLARFVFTIPTGQLADKLGRRKTLAIGGLVSAVGNGWCALAGSYTEFVFARFLAGGGSAIVLTAGAIVLADISRRQNRGRTMALYQATFIFAVGVGPLPGGLLAEWYGLSAPFATYGVMSILAGFVAWFLVPETQALQSGIGSSGVTTLLPPLRDQFKLLTQHTGFLLVGLVNLVNAFVRTGAVFNVVPVLAAVKLGLSPGQIGGALAIGSVLGLVASYPGGYLADRFGRKTIIVPSLVGKAAAMVLFAIATDLMTFTFASILWGIMVSLAGSAPAAYAADIAPKGMNAAAMSGYRLLGESGYIIGPVILGLIVDWSGPEVVLWICAVLILVVCAVFAKWAKETHRAPG
ncbi:MAG: MFS transporter [Burkholderiaceae bacterium]